MHMYTHKERKHSDRKDVIRSTTIRHEIKVIEIITINNTLCWIDYHAFSHIMIATVQGPHAPLSAVLRKRERAGCWNYTVHTTYPCPKRLSNVVLTKVNQTLLDIEAEEAANAMSRLRKHKYMYIQEDCSSQHYNNIIPRDTCFSEMSLFYRTFSWLLSTRS